MLFKSAKKPTASVSPGFGGQQKVSALFDIK